MDRVATEGARRRPGAATVLRVAVAVAALVWVLVQLRTLDWQTFAAGLRHTRWDHAAACYLLTIVIYGIRLWRLRSWTHAVAPVQISWPAWIDVYVKSIALGSLSPARLGDFSRIVLLRGTGAPPRVLTRLVFLDKLSDFLYVPLALFVTAPIVTRVVGIPEAYLILGGAGCIVGYLVAARLIGDFLSFPMLLAGLGLTTLAFALFAVSNAFLFWAAGIDLPLADVTAVVVAVGVLANLPISVGGLGVREAGLVAVLGRYGVQVHDTAVLVVLECGLNLVLPIVLYLAWTFGTRAPRAVQPEVT